MSDRPSSNERGPVVLAVQAAYSFGTGVWPLLDDRSFQAVTGPKRDLWLAKTVGCLIGVVSAALGLAWMRGHPSPETKTLAIGTAGSLLAVDVVYVTKRTISPIYLLDAAVEAAFLAAWAAERARRR